MTVCRARRRHPTSVYLKRLTAATRSPDITDDIYKGSVRARGRGGAFSRFVIVHDGRNFAVLPILGLTVALLDKVLSVVDAIDNAGITDGSLVTELVDFLLSVNPPGVVVNLLTLNVTGAIANVNDLLTDVISHAGTDIPNFWSAASPTTDGAGQIISAADTLNFTLSLLNGTPTCTAPPP